VKHIIEFTRKSQQPDYVNAELTMELRDFPEFFIMYPETAFVNVSYFYTLSQSTQDLTLLFKAMGIWFKNVIVFRLKNDPSFEFQTPTFSMDLDSTLRHDFDEGDDFVADDRLRLSKLVGVNNFNNFRDVLDNPNVQSALKQLEIFVRNGGN